jgi:DNA repair protein RecO (recombination protein O)
MPRPASASRLTTAKRAVGSGRLIVSHALVVRVVPYGEADAIVTLFTEELGKVSALGRGARKSVRRFAAALEPMHGLRVTLQEKVHAEVFGLREAVVVTPRAHILRDLDRMEAAGQALRWARAGSPTRTKEPAVFAELTLLLDRLNDPEDALSPRAHLAGAGLRFLRHFGYGLELDHCVRCFRGCDPARSAFVDAAAGGLLCQACGGGHSPLHHLLAAAARTRLAAAAAGTDAALQEDDAALAKHLVDEALAAHAGVTE